MQRNRKTASRYTGYTCRQPFNFIVLIYSFCLVFSLIKLSLLGISCNCCIQKRNISSWLYANSFMHQIKRIKNALFYIDGQVVGFHNFVCQVESWFSVCFIITKKIHFLTHDFQSFCTFFLLWFTWDSFATSSHLHDNHLHINMHFVCGNITNL